MFFYSPSHRTGQRIDNVLGRHPQYFWKKDNMKGGVYFWLDCSDDVEHSVEIEKVIAAGAKKCRDQKRENYLMCW